MLPFLILPMLIGIGAASAPTCAISVTVVGLVASAITLGGRSAWGLPMVPADLGPLAVMLAACAVTALPFAALMNERRADVRALEASNTDLETRVAARTAEARANESRLRQILDSSPAGVCVTRPSGQLIYANSAFRSLFGVGTAEQANGLDVTTLFAEPVDRERFLEQLKRNGVVSGHGDKVPLWGPCRLGIGTCRHAHL